MKANWIGNRRLQALVKSGGAILRPEIVTIVDSDMVDTRSEWDAGTVTGAGTVAILDSGGARLEPADTIVVPEVANDGTNITRLTHIPTSDVVIVEWIGGDPEATIRNIRVRLDPRRDGGQPKTVAFWRMQLFRVTRWTTDGFFTMAPISKFVDVAASGDVAADYTFQFEGLDGGLPQIGLNPQFHTNPSINVTNHPTTLVQLVALTATGAIADNVTWLADGPATSATDGSTYIVSSYEIQSGADDEYRLLVAGATGLPEIEINAPEYADAAIITFDGANEIADLTGSGDVVVVARGEQPGDSAITYEISDDGGANWFDCFDGDLLATDNTAQGGGNLTAVAATGPWDLRVTLTPSTDTLHTPVVRTFGLEKLASTWLTGAAELEGGGRNVDPVTLKGNIAAADLLIAKTGENDYKDYGSKILVENHIGAISVRIWVADVPGAGLLDRPEWMLHSVWDLDDYVSTDTHHRLSLISPLRRLRNIIIPPFVVTSGSNGTRTAVEVAGTLTEAYEEILDGMVGLPARWRGPGIEDATNTVAKRIARSEAKDELDRLALLDGSAIIESQGRIRTVKVMRDDTTADTPVAHFPHGSYEAGEFGPGYSTRTDEYFVLYEWSEGLQEFDAESRYGQFAALANLGGVGINTTQQLDEETAKWITTSTLADLVGKRVPHHFATGLILWPIRSHLPHPELEIGDPVTIETTRFVGRSPVTSAEVRGRVGALAIVVDVGDRWGYNLVLWVPSFDQIVPVTGTVTPKAFARLGIFHKDTTTRSAPDDLNENTIATIVIPAGGLGAGSEARIDFTMSSEPFFDTSDLRVKINGNLIGLVVTDSTLAYEANIRFRLRVTNTTSASAQRAELAVVSNLGVLWGDVTSGFLTTHAEDSTAAINITITVDKRDASANVDLIYSIGELVRVAA